MTAHHIEVVLFDVGGVLIRLAGIDAWKDLTGETDEAALWRRWLHCPVVRDFERGYCSADNFAHRMVDKYNLPLEPTAFLTAFASWPVGLYDGARDVVADVGDHLRVGCFSNTSELHWTQPCNREVHGLFDMHFLSYEIGHVKPDVEAFLHVADALACAPKAIFFIDDNIINVEAARACGFEAHVAKGPEEAGRLLADHGLVKAEM